MVSFRLKSSHISKQMQFQEARARPLTSAGCDLSCAVNGIVGGLGYKTSAWSAGPAYNAGSFPGDFKNAGEHSEAGGDLPGQGRDAHLGPGCPNQIFIIFEQNSSDAIKSRRVSRDDCGGSGGRGMVSVCKKELRCPLSSLPT